MVVDALVVHCADLKPLDTEVGFELGGRVAGFDVWKRR